MRVILSLGRAVFIAVISAASLVGLLRQVHAEMSGWAENEGGRMRLVALPPDADGHIRAGLQIEPKPGWITYWREPGSNGIPPQISVAPQSGVKLDAISYPVPKHIFNGKVEDIGYAAPVTLPLSLTASKVGPVVLDATAFIGICKDICIPFQAQFSLKLGASAQSHPQEETILQSAAARLPEAPSADFDILAHSLSPDRKQLALKITLPEAESGTPDIVVTGPSGYAFTKQMNVARSGKAYSADIAIGKLPKNYDIRGKQWGVLIIDGARAMESTLAFD
ncbi:protein-disulfide reductase DsbD domain-containing protein [Rhizobium mesosinicum]|uniref:Cytochrome C biogenesis protein n=1 Tax=Rhizobium mesosinicum TaxID=335017 RepID=A0ABS7H532_9HYPH|nr:protein-disulfide reductase DsbD domain-containing protein [Rhizobium mesosinicum]MBW9056439.1 cytochrome C biogenesis protein [Rhizobium mesosinicum]